MDTREALRRRPDVPDDDIDDIIGIAQELKDAERPTPGATLDEVKAVARELDLEPHLVEQAIDVLRARRTQEAEAATKAAERAAARAATTRRSLLLGGVGVAALLATGGLAAAVRSSGHAAAVREAEAVVARAEANLDVVLQRQASLAPQLLALAGGDASGLDALAREVSRGTMADRLAASDALALELSKRLGALAPATDDATAQQRLSLHHELTGAQNRITVERRRWEDARLALTQAQGG